MTILRITSTLLMTAGAVIAAYEGEVAVAIVLTTMIAIGWTLTKD
jgi:hypothetical protein